MSGVSLAAYWVANFLWDFTLYCLPLACTMLVILAFDLPAFSGVHCRDWNSTSPLANPLKFDFFVDETPNCSAALAVYSQDQGLLPFFGKCIAVNASDQHATDAFGSLKIIGENVPWNAAACSAVSLAPDEWVACMDASECKAEVLHAMRPGQSFNSILDPPVSFPPADMTTELAAVAARVLQHMDLAEATGLNPSACVLEMVRFSKPLCELTNENNAAKSPPLPLSECDATLKEVCPVSTDTCPISRTVGTFLLFAGFGVAIIPFSYLLAYCFATHTIAQVFSILVTFTIGLILSLVSMMLDTLPFEDPELAASNRANKWIYRMCSPGYALGNGLLDMAFSSFGMSLGADSGARLLVAPSDPLEWNYSGKDIFFLFASAPVFLALVIIVDVVRTYPTPHIPCSNKCSNKCTTFQSDAETVDEEDDEDVIAEAVRVRDGGADGDAIRLAGLWKVYDSSLFRCFPRFIRRRCCKNERCKTRCKTELGERKIAVRNLSFGIPRGEVFGFLGINGAGKTTTMNILTGGMCATSGDAWLNGRSIRSQQLLCGGQATRPQLGYSPQHDALIDLLSVKEHLYLFGRIKGICSERDLPGHVAAIIAELDLGEFVDRPSGQLSGGNKRKLSVAIATMGRPPLVCLDEPSTGMDPLTRRKLWASIDRNTKQGQSSVILTTHSMAECEALCQRVGIMVGGRLRCLGTVQHLKSRFGQGLV